MRLSDSLKKFKILLMFYMVCINGSYNLRSSLLNEEMRVASNGWVIVLDVYLSFDDTNMSMLKVLEDRNLVVLLNIHEHFLVKGKGIVVLRKDWLEVQEGKELGNSWSNIVDHDWVLKRLFVQKRDAVDLNGRCEQNSSN